MAKRLAVDSAKQLAVVAPKRLAIETPKQLAVGTSDAPDDAGEAACSKLAYDYSARLKRLFFDRPSEDLAKALLGKLITEAYPGGDDKGSHSFNGKRTARNEAMYMDPGTAYVYNIYGTWQCLNVSSRGYGSAVLIRAAEPLFGLEAMTRRRSVKELKRPLKPRDLCSGPSKLCQALGITKAAFDQKDTTVNEELFFTNDLFVVDQSDVVVKSRIGLEGYGAKWAALPLRFYLRDNVHVSVK
uniref:DNA-3-methyladenine glycosylase n=1 Tax=Plectus sambesii TaxID=2011161 RepID=A0A914UI08_9BILA